MKNQKQISRTPSAEAFTQLILETFRFNGRLLAAGDRLTKELGLTSALWQVLGAINEAPLPVAQVARNMGLTRQSVRRTANVLKDRGFVEFQDNPNHQRAKLVVLSKKGRNVLDQATKLQIDWANSVSKGLGDNKLKTAIQTMRTIGDRL
ncbi:MAG: MarR family transcriptional regulator [Thermodesulfobacteriota bacterium]|nr:MarR family transcriptional regulator [Thermodesulfobacteriota bacterium]